jgi:hypothetical protein
MRHEMPRLRSDLDPEPGPEPSVAQVCAQKTCCQWLFYKATVTNRVPLSAPQPAQPACHVKYTVPWHATVQHNILYAGMCTTKAHNAHASPIPHPACAQPAVILHIVHHSVALHKLYLYKYTCTCIHQYKTLPSPTPAAAVWVQPFVLLYVHQPRTLSIMTMCQRRSGMLQSTEWLAPSQPAKWVTRTGAQASPSVTRYVSRSSSTQPRGGWRGICSCCRAHRSPCTSWSSLHCSS